MIWRVSSRCSLRVSLSKQRALQSNSGHGKNVYISFLKEELGSFLYRGCNACDVLGTHKPFEGENIGRELLDRVDRFVD